VKQNTPGTELTNLLEPLRHSDSVATETLREVVFAAYARETGESVNTNSVVDRQKVCEWLRNLSWNLDSAPGADLHYRPRRLSHFPLFPGISEKISWLHQSPCATCYSYARSNQINLPISVPPWSHQSQAKYTVAFKAALANRAGNLPPLIASKDGRFCVRILFVLSASASLKDCDNMAKGFLDAMQGYLYLNDNQIDHLEIMRIISDSTSGYILIRCMETTAFLQNDLVDEASSHATILGTLNAETMDLTQYLT
jgi:Holliday junction resolvase RusA-like endonuclease